MQFEEYDNKIKEAADNHHPAYDEQAWTKMKKLLDTHLPYEKKKESKKVFPFLFFILMGLLGIFIGKPDSTIENYNALGKNKIATTNNKQERKFSDDTFNVLDKSQSVSLIKIAEPEQKRINIPEKVIPVRNLKIKNTKFNTNPIDLFSRSKSSLIYEEAGIVNKVINFNPTDDSPSLIGNINSIVKTENREDALKNNSDTNQKAESADKISYETVSSELNSEEVNTKMKKTANSKNKVISNFIFTVSGGMDISFINIDKPGKMTPLNGLGVGYAINKKLTLRTGFYTSNKIYSAKSESYNPPGSFYNYYPYLEKVDADCKVYEIPVLISYSLKPKNGYTPFITTGLSTLLMKKETYNYYYKNTLSGPVLNRAYTIENKNKHIMSVITISGGIQKVVNSKLSLMAEPYFKLPLVGIGYGDVKLNSFGILFSVGFKPFSDRSRNK